MKSTFIRLFFRLMVSLIFLGYSFFYTSSYADASSTTVQDVSLPQLANLVQEHKHKGNITLIFVYGSWCPVCQRNFPQLQQLSEQYQEGNLSILAFSLDRDKDKLLHYLDKQSPISFFSYRLLNFDRKEISKTFSQVGITYNHTVPFIAVFDQQGTLIGEGNYSVASTAKVVQYLLSKHNKIR